MKKFFSLCLMSMAVATMSAQTQDLPFTVNPEPGSILEQIETVTLTLNPGYEEFDINQSGEIHFNYNGEEFCAAKSTDLDTQLVFKPSIPILQYGEYELVIPAGAICWYEADYADTIDNEDIVIPYTIGFGGDDPVSGDYPFFVDPTPGSVVPSLDMITLTLDIYEGDYMFMEIEIPEDLYVRSNGEQLPIEISVESEEGEILYLKLDTPITEAGEYEVVIPAGAIVYMDGEENFSDNEEEIVLKYTVGNEVVGPTEPAFTVSPASGSEVETLDAITFTVNSAEGYEWFDIDPYEAYFTRDGEKFCGIQYEESDDYLTVTVTPDKAITEPGNYELVFSEYTFICSNEENNPFYINEEDLVFSYIVTGASEPAGPVVYDVEPTGYNPKDGAELDFDSRDFNGLTISVAQGIRPAEDAYLRVIPVGYEDEALEALLTFKDNGMNQIRAEFATQEYNGEYIVIIPQGSFGDEAWLSDPETGHANAEIELHYFVVNAYERESAISYTLMPEVTWNEDLTIFTLVFEEETFLSKYYPFATLAGVNVNYSVYTNNIVDNGNSTFTITFAEAPTEDGTYRFSVEPACFGDAEFIESDEEAGVANAEISIEIDITPTAIKAINADNVKAGVYNLYGVKVADSTNNLPAGIYIVNGKKVVVK